MFIKRFMPFFDTLDTGGGDPIGDPAGGDPQDDGNAQPQAKITITYNGEEREIDLEEAKTLAQKGMNYDPVQQKWEDSKNTLNAFEEIARKAGFVNADGHGDLEAYRTAASEQLKELEIDTLIGDTKLPKELAEELYLSRQERAERKAEKEKQKAEQQNQAQYAELLSFYKEVHGKDFDATTKLPDEVWQATSKGIPPKYAYAEYLTRQSLKEKLIDQANADNAGASPGGTTGKAAGAEKEFFTSEEIDKLTPEELDDPNIFAKAMKSLSKIGK